MLIIWTDGSCYPNPGTGGWGWCRSDGKERFGGEKRTTNNRMEMTAILQSLIELPDEENVLIYSDSQYCVKGLTEWHKGWKKKNWLKKGLPMINRDLWLSIDEHVSRINVTFKWVRGHSGDKGNERADYLSVIGRESLYERNYRV
jgi:ribonuclease HI